MSMNNFIKPISVKEKYILSIYINFNINFSENEFLNYLYCPNITIEEHFYNYYSSYHLNYIKRKNVLC